MDVLSAGNPERRAERRDGPAARWLVPLVFVVLTGCMVFDVISFGDEPIAFSHRLHVEEEGLSCTDCHLGAEDEDDPGMPTPALCSLCHDEDSEAEKPAERRIEALLVGEAFASAGKRFADEVIFPHLAHVEAMDCTGCHAGIESNDDVRSIPLLGMDDCMSCHGQLSVANDCRTCHSEISRDRPPASHAHAWLEVHGGVVRSRSEAVADDCTLCHTRESDCRTCHQEMAPRDHTNHWRLKGHGLMAQLDRTSCAVCHRTDACNRCHRDAEPVSHRGPWATSLNTHCLSCHQPIATQGCATCHQTNPAHLSAAPLPANHNPAMNCRQCHGLSAPMPHVDNGDECIQCHF